MSQFVIEKPFCVIGECSGMRLAIPRHWKAQKEEAIQHAQQLLDTQGNISKAVSELIVVRAVSLVRVRPRIQFDIIDIFDTDA